MLLVIIGACNWPAARDLGPPWNILRANSSFWVFVHFSRSSSFWVFFVFWFWKQRNFFNFLCFLEAFLEMWRDPGTPADSYYQVRPECTDVPKTRFKIKVRFFFMTYILFGFFDTLLDFLDIYACARARTHTHIYIYMAWIKEGGNK